jgi:hypothetical protein
VSLLHPVPATVPGGNTRKSSGTKDMTTRSPCTPLLDKRLSREHTLHARLVLGALKPGGGIGLIGEEQSSNEEGACLCNDCEIRRRLSRFQTDDKFFASELR